ncbi:hypothetical protein [Eilatimonas milleporae]|uniref:Lipopolysaccharide export system protein LptC n=1 Tax=Eilatimonas milleporae TaxID=911205 RepID=A0A3M0C0Q1_9PROT|nr:hypothetical protein [Eilatimonas milleporae]RMB01910.1 hypothetical protein BXY39_3418 [Eilatimonas milleporae]
MHKADNHYASPTDAKLRARAALTPQPAKPASGSWDRFVAAMRIVLPVAAIVLGSVTVFWPLLSDTEVSFTLSKEEVAASDDKVRMTNLRYRGTDAVDRLFTITAASGMQDDPASPRIRLEDLSAQMDLEPGLPARVEARTGVYRLNEGRLSLVGGVELTSGADYALTMSGAEVQIKSRVATGHGNVSGRSRLGTLEAARVEIRIDESKGVFDGGVALRITPARARTGAENGSDAKPSDRPNEGPNDRPDNGTAGNRD